MKLAQALSERADLKKRIEQLRSRLSMNALVQEGEKPAEEPERLLNELSSAISQLETLVARINNTNSVTVCGPDTLTALLARRDCMGQHINVLREFLSNASSTGMRGTRSEIKIISTVCVADLQKNVDAMAKELRELDIRIQELNWQTELI